MLFDFMLTALIWLSRCGLRYARSRAKKEGGTTRRRKDKVLDAMSNKAAHSPSTSPVNVPFDGNRRGSIYEDSAFMPGTSATSSDGFVQQVHTELNGMKQSPSPSNQHATFAAYPPAPPEHQNSPAADHRQFATHPYYAPLPNIDMPSNNQAPTLPRLDATMPYPPRLPPSMHHSSSPAPPPHMQPNPYDRERQREKGYETLTMPPAPLAADGRGVGPGRY